MRKCTFFLSRIKQPYMNDINKNSEFFHQIIIFTLFPPLISTLFGFILLKIFKPPKPANISFKSSAICGLIINFNMYTYNQAIVYSSFSAVLMVKSCGLLSVILVAVFCSRVRVKKLQLGREKILIGIIATIGVFVFNYFKDVSSQISDRPIKLVSSVFLILSLLGDGFLPDFQAVIKSKYQPSSLEMYYSINLTTFMIALGLSIVTLKIFPLIQFLLQHKYFCFDVALFSVLNSIGQLFVYKFIKDFRQHIPTFVLATRKCTTVLVNILYFGHSLNYLQIIGISLFFLAIFAEIMSNYYEKKKTFVDLEQQDKQNRIQNDVQTLDDKIQNESLSEHLQHYSSTFISNYLSSSRNHCTLSIQVCTHRLYMRLPQTYSYFRLIM